MKGKKGLRESVGKAAGAERALIPWQSVGLVDEAGSNDISDAVDGKGVTGPLNWMA
jgi:hypothetical protein